MRPPAGRIVRAGAFTLLGSVAAGTILLAAAIVLYPGGTVFERQGHGAFWLNFLCDLTAEVGLNGVPNPKGSACAIAALGALGLALVCFWSILPQTLAWRGKTARVTRCLGLVSLLGLAIAPFASGRSHIIAVLGSAFPAIVAGGLGAAATLRHAQSRLVNVTATVTVLAALIDAALYIDSYLHVPRIVVPALPIFQRIALIGTLTWISAIAWMEVRRGSSVNRTRTGALE